jgi:cytochrome c
MLFKGVVFFLLVWALGGCEEKVAVKYDAKALIEKKCAQCHNLDLPPKSFANEVAPPMMAVAFHVQSFMDVSDESLRIPKAVEFVKDYVFAPSKSKSLCDEASLKSYGLMPSQKGNLSEGELDAIARYLFSHYTQEKLDEAQALINKLKAMPAGERIALQNNCLTCHRVNKHIVGPSLKEIASRYKNSPELINKSIFEGSRERWADSKKAIMPPFQKLTSQERELLTQWILSL